MYRQNEEVQKCLEICETCEFKDKKETKCYKLSKPCDLKRCLRYGECPLKKWDNTENNGV